MTIDVIVPVFNGERSIKRCIMSVLRNAEQCLNGVSVNLVIVDDGSTDATSNIVARVQTEYDSVQYLKQANSGVASARNYGIDKTTGDYIVFLDADDWLPDYSIQRLLKCALENNTDIAIGKSRYYLGKIPITSTSETWHNVSPGVIDIAKDNFLVEITPGIRAKIFSRRLFEYSRFPKDRIKWEDLALVPALIAKAGVVSYVDDAVYNYTVHMNTTVKDFLFQCNVLDIIKSLDILKENLLLFDVYDRLTAEYNSMLTLHTLFRAENVVTWINANRYEKKMITSKLIHELNRRYPDWKNDAVLTDPEKRYKDLFFNFMLNKCHL